MNEIGGEKKKWERKQNRALHSYSIAIYTGINAAEEEETKCIHAVNTIQYIYCLMFTVYCLDATYENGIYFD